MRTQLRKLGLVSVIAIALGACETTPADLEDSMTRDSIPKDVQPAVAAFPKVTLPFDTLEYDAEQGTHKDSATDAHSDSLSWYHYKIENLGDGIVRASSAELSDGGPFATTKRFFVALEYLNVLQFQVTGASYAVPDHPLYFDVNHDPSVKILTPGAQNPTEHGTYVFERSDAKGVIQNTCTAGAERPASQMLVGMPGQALDLKCIQTQNGNQTVKWSLVFLRAYGVYLYMQSDDGSYDRRSRILSMSGMANGVAFHWQAPPKPPAPKPAPAVMAPKTAAGSSGSATMLSCKLHPDFAWYDATPTIVELDEAHGLVTVHFGPTHMRNPRHTTGGADGRGGTAAEVLGPVQATFGANTITFGPWTLDRVTGELTRPDGWWTRTCNLAKPKF